jgi:hypothetical protein
MIRVLGNGTVAGVVPVKEPHIKRAIFSDNLLVKLIVPAATTKR